MTTTAENAARDPDKLALNEEGRLSIPAYTPMAVCDAISKAAAAVEIRRADVNLGVLRRRNLPATHPSIVALEARKAEAQNLDLEAVDFREGAKEMPTTELLRVLRELKIPARVETAHKIVADMPMCEHALKVRIGIEGIKEKLAKQQAGPTCGATDDRLGELDAPSAEAMGKVAACAGR